MSQNYSITIEPNYPNNHTPKATPIQIIMWPTPYHPDNVFDKVSGTSLA